MLRFLAVIALAAALLAVAAPAHADAPAHRADGRLGDWRGKPTNLAGKSILSRGELVYTDWLYDDYGPDLDGTPGPPAFRGAGAVARGDYRYPDDPTRYGHNAADLREVRITADKRSLHVLIALQTMKTRDAAVVMLALDGDDTSAGEWPADVGIATPKADRFVVAWGTGARLIGPAGERKLRTAANLRENVIEVEVPLKSLALKRSAPSVWVVAGLHDGNGEFREQTSGETAVFNAAFRPDESFERGLTSTWGENQQGAQLAQRDVTPFARSLPLRRMQRRASDRRAPPAPGFYNRIFRSDMKLGEGIVLDPNASPATDKSVAGGEHPQFLSPYQPYSLYVPTGYSHSRPNPLTLVGHSLEVNHIEYRAFAPNLLKQLGDERGSVLITPLARGIDSWYLDAGLADVIEAWNDVRGYLTIDEERTSVTGYSMGGYMTYRLGLLMPDRFARASSYVGPPAFYFWPYPLPLRSEPKWEVAGNTNLIVENARNLPFEIVHGNLDELVPVSGVQHQADSFGQFGNDYRFYRHAADDHLSFMAADEWSHTRDWLGDSRRIRNPIEVVFRRYPAMDLAHRGLFFDGAYWVDGIKARASAQPGDYARVEAVTYGLGGSMGRPEELATQIVTGPATPGTLTGQERVPGQSIGRQNGFRVRLSNTSGLSFDTWRMGIDPSRRVTIDVQTDGDTRFALYGGFPRVVVRSGTRRLRVARTSRAVRFTVPTGTQQVTVAPR